MTLRATGIHYSPFVNEPPDRYARRRLTVEADGDVLRMETAGLARERNNPFGSAGVRLEVDLDQVPLLIAKLLEATDNVSKVPKPLDKRPRRA